MKKIVMTLTNGFLPDPRVYKEAVYLMSRGFHVTILCWDRGECFNRPEVEILDGIEIIRFRIPSVWGSGYKQIGNYLKYIRKCRAYLKAHYYDYIHCNDIDGAVVGILARKRDTNMVFDMHEFYEFGNKLQCKLMRYITLFFIKISVAALYENDVYTLKNSYSNVRNKLHRLKNYPDSHLILQKPKTESLIFRIAYHGGVRTQTKEFEALFNAVKNMNDVRVDVNGVGRDVPYLKEISKDQPNVHINGAFDGIKALTALYEKTDLLYCGYALGNPNQEETAEPVKYFEAILTGTPMLATESLSIGKKVKANGFGLVCDTRDANAIREAIIRIKNDKELWKRCSENELAQAYKYDWQEEVKILDKVYKL